MPTGQTYIRSYLEAQHRKLSKEVDSKRLNLECLKACVAVYHSYDELHPSEFGLGSTVKNLTDELTRAESELATVCEALAWWESVAEGEPCRVVRGSK